MLKFPYNHSTLLGMDRSASIKKTVLAAIVCISAFAALKHSAEFQNDQNQSSNNTSDSNLCSIPTIDDDNIALRESNFKNSHNSGIGLLSLVPIPQLQSKPGQPITLILDFDGHPAHSWASYNVPITPAYDRDGDANSVSQSEADGITEIWRRVSESYSPFNINVTTIDSGSYPVNTTAKVIIGGYNTWLGGGGGVAILTSFAYPSPRWSFCFAKNLGNGEPKYTADCIAHEAGHMFGLNHQATYSGTTLTSAYNQGNADFAPIMGVAYYSQRGLWWYGQTDGGSTIYQDDIPVMDTSTINFAVASDDYGDTKNTATSLPISSLSFSTQGIIERLSDTDVFSFSTGAGAVNINISPNSNGPTLDLKASLKNDGGTILADSDPSNSLAANLSATVSAGTYYIYVSSNGSNPGDLGTYSITGSIPSVNTNTPVPTATTTPTPQNTSTRTATPTSTRTATPTVTPISTSTSTPLITSTNTATATFTSTSTSPAGSIFTSTATPVSTEVATVAPTTQPTLTSTPTATATATSIVRLQILSPESGSSATKTINLKILVNQLDLVRFTEKQGRSWSVGVKKSSTSKTFGFRYTLRGTASDMTVSGYSNNKLVSQQSYSVKLGKFFTIKQSAKIKSIIK